MRQIIDPQKHMISLLKMRDDSHHSPYISLEYKANKRNTLLHRAKEQNEG